jgi:hypothetical protein
MVSSVNTTAANPLKLPDKTHVDTASASVFGMVFQQNTNHFATLETAQTIARLLGGTVVDLGEQWGGGSQTPQYGIQMGTAGPVLNAGLVAAQCQGCGVEAGLSRALVEVGMITGNPISMTDALARIQANTVPKAQTSGNPPSAPTPVISNPSVSQALVVQNAPPPASEGSIINIQAPPAAQPTIPLTSATEITAGEIQSETASQETAQLQEAARQFEALMVEQMLKSVREESSGGWTGSEENSSQFSAVDFAQTQLAQAIAAQGGLGLAQLVLRSLGSQVSAHTFTNPNSAPAGRE